MSSDKETVNQTDSEQVVNRLAKEKSPYLLQHAHNPVDWHPWGEEAFCKARDEDRPIFLSVGYATCHWCHVMAHESFEDQEVAGLLNRLFVPVKVDREERPDIDSIYMTACQALTQRGGWPLSVFLTPEGKPFFAGTYYPKHPRMGMPGFVDILQRIAALWKNDRSRLLDMGEEVARALQPRPDAGDPGFVADKGILEKAFGQLAESFDPVWGGFDGPPKFPIPHNLTFLLRWHDRSGSREARDMLEKTLKGMRNGGIFDQLGFGFHRYSVDEKWLVPHFEKMLYDQAQLAMCYTEAFQSFGETRYADVVREIFAYVLNDMTSPEGGFYSAEDADSEGKEGIYYVWRPEEVKELLGRDDGELVCRFFDILPEGNFEGGLSIPHVPVEPAAFAEKEGMAKAELDKVLDKARDKLLRARRSRIPPLKDDKILTAWNGLMIAALAKGSQATGVRSYAEAASKSADFIMENLAEGKGRLFRRYRQGEAAFPGYLDDYAFLVWGLIELYEATFDIRYLEEAVTFQESMIDLFWDGNLGGFFFSGRENESLIVKNKDAYDQAVPSGNSVAAMNLVRLGRMTGNTEMENKADQVIRAFSRSLSTHPVVHTQFLAALDFMIGPSREIVITGNPEAEGTWEMARSVQRMFLPNKVLLVNPEGVDNQKVHSLAPYLEAMKSVDEKPTAYVCEQYACKHPITNTQELAEALKA